VALPQTTRIGLDSPARLETSTVPDAVAPPPRHPRFPLFDGLRAIAVLCVVVVHIPGADALPTLLQRLLVHLNLGVVIFFVISGFLLYRPFIAARGGGAAAPAVGDYARRRFLRIVPAYWLALTVLTVLPGVVGVAGSNPIPQYALVHTLPLFGGPTCYGFTDCGLAQTWSLVIEVSFYAALPLYAWAAYRLTRRLSGRAWMRAELVVLTGLATASVLLHFAFFDDSLWVGSTVIGAWLLFAFGTGLAVASVALGEGRRRPALVRATASRPGAVWLAAIVLYIALCLSLPIELGAMSRAQNVILYVGLGVVALLLVLPAVFGSELGGWPRRVLAHPLIAWLGLVSYGIFLWHLAIARELGAEWGWLPTLVGTLALSVAVAATSYYLVERPILRLKYHRLSELIGRR
jgi:peptidoglycan/LPS O-acetylase OafA/YrhL